MSSVVISGDTSGAITLSAPAVSGTNTATLPAATGTVMVSGNMPAFSAYQSVSQTGISAGTQTKVTYDAEEFDTNSNFASSRFTPTVAGYYQVGGSVYNNSAQVMVVTIYKNGSAYRVLGNSNNSAFACISGNSLCYANGTTDYFEIYVFLVSGGSLDSTTSRTWFTGCLVRTA
jgi:hypothetical protein